MTSKLRTLAALVASALSLGAALPSRSLAAEGYTVIVHSSNRATSLSREEAAQYFLKKATSWPSGGEVAAVDLQKHSAAREEFSRVVLHKSMAEVNAYWRQQVFSGRAVPPPEKQSDADVVAFVESNEGAIGYVSAGADLGGAKALRLVD